MPRLTNYYWDSSVFIAYITQESSRTLAELSGIDEVVALIAANRARLMTSSVADTEILTNDLSEESRDRYLAVFESPKCIKVPMDHVVAREARILRESLRRDGYRIASGDVIHIATAILYDADEFHSFDKDHHLRLDGTPYVRGLRVCKPRGGQGLLKFD